VTPFSLQLYRVSTRLAAPFAPALLRSRARRGKEDAARLGERIGHASRPRPSGSLVWLHGASVGESLSLLPLIEALIARRPDLAVLVTSGTVTSATLMAQRLPPDAIHQYAPIDTPAAAARFLRHWKPSLAVFVESEIWPNLLFSAKAQGAKLALLSARLSDASLKGWERLPRTAETIFGAFDRVLAQDDATAAALRRLGARDDGRLNLKRLGAPPPVDPDALETLQNTTADRPVLLAASTHPGEEEIVLAAFGRLQTGALLVIVPRHPVRAADIAAFARAAGQAVGMRSRGDPFGAAPVYIADTLGELGLWFSLAQTAFIGGSLLPGPGGHNPVEAAQLGCPILAGPHLDNWRDVYVDLFRADAAVSVESAEILADAFAADLSDPEAARRRAERARQVVTADRDALNLAVEGLISLL
jgi:3-deoxy-D-manno-octulosonic-acid transferase